MNINSDIKKISRDEYLEKLQLSRFIHENALYSEASLRVLFRDAKVLLSDRNATTKDCLDFIDLLSQVEKHVDERLVAISDSKASLSYFSTAIRSKLNN